MRTKVDLIHGDILKSMLLFAIPMLISNIFQQLYNTVDTMIVGHYLGDESLAAIGACTAVVELMIGFALGIGNGLGMVVARSYGAQNECLLKRSVAGALVIGIIVTGVVMLVSRFGLMPLLQMLDTPPEIINESYSYISTLTMFVGVTFAYNLFAGLLRAIGNSVMPLVFLILSSLMNVGLDILFITRFQMGVRGTAVATVVAQAISAVLCLIYILTKNQILIPKRKHFAPNAQLYAELAGQGISMGLMSCIVSAGTVVLQSSINKLGAMYIAGHTAARKINSLCTMPLMTIAHTLATFVSQNKGADEGARIRKGVRYGNLLSIAWGVLITVVLFLEAPLLVKFLTGSKESIIIENGARYLRWNAPFYTVLGMLLLLRNSLQGLGKKMIPLVSSIIELLGKIVFTIVFIPTMGYFGVIICEPVIWCLMCIQLAFSFYRNPYIRQFGHKQKDEGENQSECKL